MALLEWPEMVTKKKLDEAEAKLAAAEKRVENLSAINQQNEVEWSADRRRIASLEAEIKGYEERGRDCAVCECPPLYAARIASLEAQLTAAMGACPADGTPQQCRALSRIASLEAEVARLSAPPARRRKR